MQTQSLPRRMAAWRFGLPLLLQSLLILAVPFSSAITYSTGRPVTLQTAPFDPYDLLRGYSQTLDYQISDPAVLTKLPGGTTVFRKDAYGSTRCGTTTLYVVLADPEQPTSPPTPWQPVRVSCDRPTSLPSHHVVLRGQLEDWRVVYGLERYYMPESQRRDLNQQIREAQRSQEQVFVVTIKVDDQGNSVPDSLWIRDQEYRF